MKKPAYRMILGMTTARVIWRVAWCGRVERRRIVGKWDWSMTAAGVVRGIAGSRCVGIWRCFE